MSRLLPRIARLIHWGLTIAGGFFGWWMASTGDAYVFLPFLFFAGFAVGLVLRVLILSFYQYLVEKRKPGP